ncbi:hypothetical protein Emag_006245 [Eimeria magna]
MQTGGPPPIKETLRGALQGAPPDDAARHSQNARAASFRIPASAAFGGIEGGLERRKAPPPCCAAASSSSSNHR